MLGKNTKDRAESTTRSTTEETTSSPSVVGKGMTVTGNCVTDGALRIQGTVVGDVTASGLDLADTGTIEGDVSMPDSAKTGRAFVVAGRVTGRVTAHTVEVKPTGVVLGGIEAEEATIRGTVEGQVDIGRRLEVSSTAVMNGDVRTERLVMEEGGRVNGSIHMGSKSAAAAGGPKGQKASGTTAEAASQRSMNRESGQVEPAAA